MLCVAVPFSFAVNPPLLSWLTANLRNTGAMTLGVPMNVSIGQIGQLIGKQLSCYVPHRLTRTSFVGIYIYKSSEAPGYPTGHFTNAGFLLTGAIVVLALRHIYLSRNRALQPGERKWQL